MRMKWLMCAAYAVAAATAYARSASIDFRTDKIGAGWNLGATIHDDKRGRKFPDDEAVLTSPLFEGNITSATVVVSFTIAVGNQSTINVFAGADDNSAQYATSVTNAANGAYTTNVFTFSAADSIHVLKFTSTRNSSGSPERQTANRAPFRRRAL